MRKRLPVRPTWLYLAVLFLFLTITLSIQFVHTETLVTAFHSNEGTHTHAPQNKKEIDRDCPACHLLNSSFSTARITPFELPPPLLNAGRIGIATVHPRQLFSVHPTSRSPPTA